MAVLAMGIVRSHILTAGDLGEMMTYEEKETKISVHVSCGGAQLERFNVGLGTKLDSVCYHEISLDSVGYICRCHTLRACSRGCSHFTLHGIACWKELG
jgi:hypothetical protein